ncbi:MAG: SGNH/GDSL hydrolase family protein [Lachnospiraceae bacterium]|nr:SGNH/GDSL hydrolase family protein [Lachnospiraceae bacterium]
MKNKKVLSVLLLCLCLVTGCGQNTSEDDNMQKEQNQESAITETFMEEPVSTPVAMTEEEQICYDMLERSVISTGNNERMKKVMEKAANGEDVTLAYIGGSITQGYNAGTTEIFAKLSSDYFRETYATTGKVNYVNAGLSGTPSLLGLIRSQRDIFEAKPDVIFVEFAVNDGQDTMSQSAFESLVRKALEQEQKPAVVLLFSMTEDGYTCQSTMQLVGMNYELPMISVPNALKPELEAGRMTWAEWADDGSHPNKEGQKLYNEFIVHYFNKVADEEPSAAYKLPEKMLHLDYTTMKMADIDSVQVLEPGSFQEEAGHEAFPKGWVKTTEAVENDSFVFEIDCRSLFFVYKEANNADYGTAEVYVDGEKVCTITSNKDSGWYNPVPVRVYRGTECKTRKVEVRMQEGDEEKAFYLLAIGYCVE